MICLSICKAVLIFTRTDLRDMYVEIKIDEKVRNPTQNVYLVNRWGGIKLVNEIFSQKDRTVS